MVLGRVERVSIFLHDFEYPQKLLALQTEEMFSTRDRKLEVKAESSSSQVNKDDPYPYRLNLYVELDEPAFIRPSRL